MKVVERILEEGHIGGAPERSAALAGVAWRVTRRVRVRVRTARVGRRPAPRPPAPRLAQRAPRARRRRRRALWDTTQDWDGIGKQVRFGSICIGDISRPVDLNGVARYGHYSYWRCALYTHPLHSHCVRFL